MKLVKLFNKLSAVALAASLVVGFASCSTTTDDPFNPNAPLTLEEYVKSEIKKAIENGGAQAKPEDPSKPGKPSGSGSLKEPKSLEFHVNADSTNAENTMIFVKYDRSAYGAEEEVKVTDAELNLYINDVKVKTYNEIVFALDEYGAEITSRGPIEDPKAMKEYKAKLSVGKAVKSGETVKIELVKASVVKVGAASGKITLADLQFALIDTDPSVDYYKELAPKAEQFQNICTLEDLTTGEEPTPTPGEEPAPTPDPEPTPEPEPTPVKSIALVKNPYAADGALQTQVKIPSELTSLSVGDKVKVAFSGTADREIGNVELMIVDTTKEAGYWTALSETKKDTFSTDINFEFVFEITKAPIGTGADSMVLAINGLDSDEAATITCTSFSIEKNADKKPDGGEEPTPTPDPEPTPTPTPDPEPEDSGLLPAAADLDWGTPVSVAGSSFASATDDSSIKITYVSNADNDYHKFKMMCGDGNENELFEGEATGFTIDTESVTPNDLHGCDFAAAPSETPAVITYKPSPAEWTKIKDGEFRLIGHGAKITKIEMEAAAGGENPEPGEKPENTNLLSAEADFPDWGQNTINITSDKFASLERGDKFTIKCKRSNHVDADYHKIEFMITGQKSVEFALGEEEGEQTLTSGPLFTVQVDSIKANGVTIQGFKATITSVVITKGDGQEPADPGLLTSEFDFDSYSASTSVAKENFTGDVVKALKFSYVTGSVSEGTSQLTLWVGDWKSKYTLGTCIGGTKVLEDEGKYNLETPTEEIQYFIYTPTEDEWDNLKAQGMAIQGYAVKLIKLELVDNN